MTATRLTAPHLQSKRHPPQVAGMFYPNDPGECAKAVDRCLSAASASPVADPKVIVAPHAGYIYSGPVAGTAYKPLQRLADRIRRVVLIGPAHRHALRGVATTSAGAWETPLGAVSVDADALAHLSGHPSFHVNDAAFRGEHSLEVQLPFLQRVLGDFSLIPLLAGDVSPATVADILDLVWGGSETLIVVSSDLSHFHDYDTAQKRDRETTMKIETLRYDELHGENACGCRGVAGALLQARKRDLRVTALDLRNSGDTAGDRRRVVGYGAYAMEDAETARLAETDRRTLLQAAFRTLSAAVKTKNPPQPEFDGPVSPSLMAMRATFVTLKVDGALRGCIGAAAPQRPLIADVVTSAYKAGFADRRFNALTETELPLVSVDISILSHPRPIAYDDEAGLHAALRPAKDGLILEAGTSRALFLPSVWESLPDPRDFVGHLKRKAGLPEAYWSDAITARRFTTESFGGRWARPERPNA